MDRCAFNVVNDGITCYSLNSLTKIAHAYNKNHDDKIEIVNDKEILYQKIKSKLFNKCSDDEKCWKTIDFITRLNDDEINKFTFKPDAPQGKHAWLSTIDIDDVMTQIERGKKDFHFLGAVPIDFDDLPILGIKNLNFENLHKKGKSKIGIVFNTDPHYKSGEHWISSYVDLDNKQVYYFDSVGRKPNKQIRNFLARATKYIMKYHRCDLNSVDIMYNYLQHQQGESECGIYSINFLKRLLNGEKFKDIIKNKISDEKINTCRKAYFS